MTRSTEFNCAIYIHPTAKGKTVERVLKKSRLNPKRLPRDFSTHDSEVKGPTNGNRSYPGLLHKRHLAPASGKAFSQSVQSTPRKTLPKENGGIYPTLLSHFPFLRVGGGGVETMWVNYNSSPPETGLSSNALLILVD